MIKKMVSIMIVLLILFPMSDATAAQLEKRPKNVIVMIGDGMGIGQMEMARLLEHGKEGRLFIETLPNVALVHTYSANNMVTDSAAAGTAIATGKKTNNESIGVTADGKEAMSILKRFKEDGKKVGLVTTSKVTDATPAAFSANVANRWSGTKEIVRQQLANEIDVILGGGRKDFEKDFISEFQDSGYTYTINQQELVKAEGDKLLGLFQPSYMNFVLDRDEQEPNLLEMTAKALEVLSRDKEGFFLLVEGGRIDHAAHAADITSVWKETIEFDDTVRNVTGWAEKNGDTLVVVLADHETMGISATEPANWDELKKISVSVDFMASQLEKGDSVQKVFKKYANIELSEEEVEQFNKNIQSARNQVYRSKRLGWGIGSMIAEKMNVGVVGHLIRDRSTTGGHTGNLVPIFTYGVGAERFEGVLDNTDVPKIIAELMEYEL